MVYTYTLLSRQQQKTLPGSLNDSNRFGDERGRQKKNISFQFVIARVCDVILLIPSHLQIRQERINGKTISFRIENEATNKQMTQVKHTSLIFLAFIIHVRFQNENI